MGSKSYWDYLVEDGRTYQMGKQIHRIYLLRLLKKLGVKSFLDVGCGTGPLYEILMDSNLREYLPITEYKGVDYSEGMIKVCEAKFPEGDFEVQDARMLKEDNQSWDAVTLMHCLDHLDDYEAAIKEAARVARKYVVIILWRPLTTSGENNLNNKNNYGREEGEWEDTHLQEYSRERLLNAFSDAGLALELQYNGLDINSGNTSNTLFLLKKT
jgi:ubiquinone/menaquinone biosynthesis C-methylase UbiE